MDGIKESGYLFFTNYDLKEEELKKHISDKVSETEELEGISLKPYNLYVNIVQNKEGSNLGYAYVWTDKTEIYNLFSGLNLDGSQRYIEYPDPEWEEPDEDLIIDSGNWGDLADEEARHEAPMIRNYLPPLVDIYKYSEDKNINVQPMIIYQSGRNSIYSKYVEDWITDRVLKRYVEKFEKDKSVYNNKAKNYKYTYPLIKFKNNHVNVIFSPRYPNTASFLINVIKKIRIKHNDKEKLIFFSQSKN